MKNKRVLIFDEPYLTEEFRGPIQSWGYDVVELSKPDFILDAISQHSIDLVILAVEMRVKGPSLWESLHLGLDKALRVLEDTEVDYFLGAKIQERMMIKGIRLPVIFFSTDSPTQLFRKPCGKQLFCPIISKISHSFWEDLKNVMDEMLTYTN